MEAALGLEPGTRRVDEAGVEKKRAALKGIADKMIVPGLDWFATAVVILGGGCDEFDEVEWTSGGEVAAFGRHACARQGCGMGVGDVRLEEPELRPCATH